jgi:hypothetical protein
VLNARIHNPVLNLNFIIDIQEEIDALYPEIEKQTLPLTDL